MKKIHQKKSKKVQTYTITMGSQFTAEQSTAGVYTNQVCKMAQDTHRHHAIKYVQKLLSIYRLSPEMREQGWQDKVAELNNMVLKFSDEFRADEWAIASYVNHRGNLQEEDILFLNFLFEHGASKFPFIINSSSYIRKSFKYKNASYLRWLLEDCECTIFGDSVSGHPLQLIESEPHSFWSQCFLNKLPDCNSSRDTAIMIAVRFNLFTLVKWLIEEKGDDINAVNDDGETALLLAVRYRKKQFITYLLIKNANIYTRSHCFETIFHCTILDPISICSPLIGEGSRVGLSSLLVRNVFFYGFKPQGLEDNAQTNEQDLLSVLIQIVKLQGRRLDEILSTEGYNLVQWALMKGANSRVPELLCEISPNLLDPLGRNLAVTAACFSDTPAFAKDLLRVYPDLDINALTPDGNGILHHLILEGKASVATFDWLIQDHGVNFSLVNGSGDTPLLLAAKLNKIAIASYFCRLPKAKIVDARYLCSKGRHVGHYLSLFDQHKLIDLLLNSDRIDISHRDDEGNTLFDLALARSSSHSATIRVCMMHLEKVNKKRVSSVLPFKTLNQLPALLNHLCKHDVGEFGPWIEDGQTPLHMACLNLSRDEISTLVTKYSLDTNTRNKKNETPFCVMIKHRHLDDVAWFHHTFQPKTTKIDAFNSSLLQVACEQGNEALVRWCVEKPGLSLSITKVRDDRCNALDIALIKENLNIVRYLWGRLTQSDRSSYIANLIKVDSPFLVYLSCHGLYVPEVSEEHPAVHVTCLPLQDTSLAVLGYQQPPLKAETSAWSGFPRCYLANSYLKELLDEISILFKRGECEGYLYGSAHYKENPSDFDILLPNIRTFDETQKAQTLIDSFIEQGGVVTSFNPNTGEWGYRKFNRYVIPVSWRQFKLEFIVSEKSCDEHAQLLDFTIGARYFNLKSQQMHVISGINAFVDTHCKKINTIHDPFQSFYEDLSRVFRAVRLVGDGFVLSSDAVSAIKHIFSSPENPLIQSLHPNKLTQQLSLLLASPTRVEQFSILFELGVLDKLIDCLSSRIDTAGNYYYRQIEPYYVACLEAMSPRNEPSLSDNQSIFGFFVHHQEFVMSQVMSSEASEFPKV